MSPQVVREKSPRYSGYFVFTSPSRTRVSPSRTLDRLHVHAFGRQRADRQVDVTVGILLSLLGDRIAEERERVAVLHQDFAERARRHRAGRRKDRLFHVIDFPYGDISIWGYLNMGILYLHHIQDLHKDREGCRVERDAPWGTPAPSSNRTCSFPAYGSPCGSLYSSLPFPEPFQNRFTLVTTASFNLDKQFAARRIICGLPVARCAFPIRHPSSYVLPIQCKL